MGGCGCGGTGTGFVPIIYNTNPETQEKVGNILEKEYNYGFGQGEDTTIYFSDGNVLVAQIYEDGKIELSPALEDSVLSEIEKIVGGKN
jgi:hypothetical protein